MSKANQAVSRSTSATSLEQLAASQKKSKRRKLSRLRLPTPPPDPTAPTQLDAAKQRTADKDAEFLDYLEGLQRSPHPALSRSTSAFAPAIVAEDAFDHLDKLYKLMEQMLSLREQNVLLHRRIQDLERFRNLQDMNKNLDVSENLDIQYDPVSELSENLLHNILFKKDVKPKVNVRFGHSLLRKSQRIRSVSTTEQPETAHFDRRASLSASCACDKQSKVSKWTKVKAAFKWEKASPTVSDAKSQDSGLSVGGMHPINYEVARYLRVPSTSDELGTSPGDSGAAEISTPATLSSASSAEEIRNVRRRTHEDTSDDEQLFTFDYIPVSKEDCSTPTKPSKAHRTPWEKMKEIIQTQTRNSFKKRHRLSAKSDESKIDEDILSDDTEDVFESEEQKSPVLLIQSPEEINQENEALALEHNIPVDVIARYRMISDEFQKRNEENCSKWRKVKKAFLSSPSISQYEGSSPTSITPSFFKRDLSRSSDENERLHLEVQKNYLELQKKLSLEFQEKIQEWERSKLNSPCTSSNANMQTQTQDDSKQQAFKKKMEEWEKIKGHPKHNMQLRSEENLPPEFRKKLQEWKKIKQSSIREGSSTGKKYPEFQPLSDDFLKKYERWKQMKSVGTSEESDHRGSFKGPKTPSPKPPRKESKKIKDQAEKELMWFEKEISKIDREKQRLERDRQKFLDREERLSKLRRSVVGGIKKEILVHTPCGYLKFEGISRKFTQKLYEWEKAQGIRPEESTMALLKSSFPHITTIKGEFNTSTLIRSKSADSVMNQEMLCPLLSQQPSSLSLNDVETLEQDIMMQTNSVPDIIRSTENLDQEEPEALIVEVEDVVEETASLLENCLEKHFAIYQKQEEHSSMCEGESKAAPTVRRSESARAQANYNLIEDIILLLKKMIENECEIENIENTKIVNDTIIIIESEGDNDVATLKDKQGLQKVCSSSLVEKIILLQEANASVSTNITREESEYAMSKLVDILENVHDISTELLNHAEILDGNIYRRNKNQCESDIIHSSKKLYPQISDSLSLLNSKILELRRNLSYICAASDLSVSSWKCKIQQKGPSLSRKLSCERRRSYRRSKSKDEESGTETRRFIKHSSPRDDLTRQIEQGAIKKRIRYRQKEFLSKTLDETDDDDSVVEQRKPTKPRRMKSQNSTESNKSEKDLKNTEPSIVVDQEVVDKVVVPTCTKNFSNFDELIQTDTQDSPVTLFVKTTRKLFTPLVTNANTSEKVKEEYAPVVSVSTTNVTHLPPLPASPTPQRKVTKEISPNIRLMMVRYNQKVHEENSTTPRSAGSSGSASPVAWRSPVLERRVKAQTERYQQELQKLSPLLGGRREVQKSASMGVVVSGRKQVTIHSKSDLSPEPSPKSSRGILKSSSVSAIETKESQPTACFKPITEIPEYRQSKLDTCTHLSISELSDVRSSKIQRAKEEFLNSAPVSAPARFRTNPLDEIKYPVKNRLSQISVGSESSYNSSAYEGVLMKSASAGMINIDADVYKQLNPEIHGDGYVSLPRAKKGKEGLLSNITSKFRKVKMRRHKDTQRMAAVSTLCRQSLLVDIHPDGSQGTLSDDKHSNASSGHQDEAGPSRAAVTPPPISKSASWIQKTKIFKK